MKNPIKFTYQGGPKFTYLSRIFGQKMAIWNSVLLMQSDGAIGKLLS